MQAAPYFFALAWQKKPDFAGPKTGPKNWPQFRGRDIILNKKGGQFLGADSGPETQKKTKPNEQKKRNGNAISVHRAPCSRDVFVAAGVRADMRIDAVLLAAFDAGSEPCDVAAEWPYHSGTAA